MAKTKTRKGAAVAAPQQGRMAELARGGDGHILDRDKDGHLRLSCGKETTGYALRLNPQEPEPRFRCGCGMTWMPHMVDDGSYRLRVSL